MDPLEQLSETLIIAAQECRENESVPEGDAWPRTPPPFWRPLLTSLRQMSDSPLGNDWSGATDAERRSRLTDFLYNNPELAGALSERMLHAYGATALPRFYQYLAQRLVETGEVPQHEVLENEEFAKRVPHLESRLAIVFAVDQELMTYAADETGAAVPFSVVLDRELKEIAISREWRSPIDPEALTLGLPKDSPDYKQAMELRELWHRLRVQEKRLIEQIDAEPERFEGVAEHPHKRIQKLPENPSAALKELDRWLIEVREALDTLDRRSPNVNPTECACETSGKLQAIRLYLQQLASRYDPETSGRQPQSVNLSPWRRADEMKTLGVAFSGGGIRSATLNLGILQSLAEVGLLRCVDYLSTVSGGGYIGSWLTSWCGRVNGGVRAIERRLNPRRQGQPNHPDTQPVRFLREYSNYLAPKTGFFSADTWTMFAIWFRNTLLNQLIIFPLLAAVLLTALAAVTLPGVLDDALQHPAMESMARRVVSALPEHPWTSSAVVLLSILAGIQILRRLWHEDGVVGPRILAGAFLIAEGLFVMLLGLGAPLCVAVPAIIATLFLYRVVVSCGRSMAAFTDEWKAKNDPPTRRSVPGKREARPDKIRETTQSYVLSAVVVPVFAGCFAAASALWIWVRAGDWHSLHLAAFCMLILTPLTILQNYRGGYLECVRRSSGKSPTQVRNRITIYAVASSAASTAVVIASALLMDSWPKGDWAWGNFAALVFGPALVAAAISVAIIMQLGLLGVDFPDERREWWSRTGAWLGIVTIVWLGVTAEIIYGPWLVASVGAKLAAAGGVAWLVTTGLGMKFAWSPTTPGAAGGNSPHGNWQTIWAQVVPYLFVGGLLVGIACVLQLALLAGTFHRIQELHTSAYSALTIRQNVFRDGSFQIPSLADAHTYYWEFLSKTAEPQGWWMVIAGAAALGVMALALSRRVDANEFSLHNFYLNRLVRCYLGASHAQRRPHRFTGFDRGDDIPLASLRALHPVEDAFRAVVPYTGPYHLVNAALNLTAGERLAWQERKADSFLFSPHYSGYHCDPYQDTANQASDGDVSPDAYRPTEKFGTSGAQSGWRRKFGNLTLGTAVSVSGAAASPNMGYNSSPAVAFLMSVFNLRLGWWCGNPRHEESYQHSSPDYAGLQLVKELLGQSDSKSDFVNLSDGGHFENMAVYELIRRRCSYIIACDGEQDGDLHFGGLGNLVRKCRVDFGVEIRVMLDELIPVETTRRSRFHCLVGDIIYPDGFQGRLLYLKSSVSGDEPADILEYRYRCEQFPHESTADQFFDESQFESYRRLGLHIGRTTLDIICDEPMPTPGGNLDRLFNRLQARWRPARAFGASV